MEKEKESEREIYEKEIAYLDLKNKIVKEIHPILLSLIVPILSDKQFDFFTTILKKDLKIPQEDSFFLSFYCEIQPIIGECKQNPLFLTPSQKEEIKNTFLQLLEKWKFKNRITYHNGEDNPYWDKISYQPK